MKVSVIIPVLNEQVAIAEKLPMMQWVRQSGHEIIVVDGGSKDESFNLAKNYADKVSVSPAGRAEQMNAGARLATGDVYLFLHVDTDLPHNGISKIITYGERIHSQENEFWGRFDVRLSGQHFMFRIIETMMNLRSRLTGIATGDQAIFISRELFKKINGYSKIPLMEDIDISHRLKKFNKPYCINDPVITSSRRWEESGIYKTIYLMWRIRLSYWLGVSPARLVKQYYS